MNTPNYLENSRLMLEGTIDALRNKSPKSTYMERLRAAGQAYEKYSELPRPLYLGYGLRYMLENVSCPVKPHDILLGRAAEWVPDEAEEKELEGLHDLFSNDRFFMVDGGHITLDWETILTIGISGYIRKAEEALDREIAAGSDKETLIFLRGMLLVYQAFRRYMIRYAEAAEAAGLSEAAEISRSLSDNPPKTFREGIQLVLYVTHVYSVYAARLNATLVCGRVDDLLCALYEKDIAEGRLDRETAGAIIDDFNCKCAIIIGRGEHQMTDGTAGDTGWFRNPMYDSPTYVIIGGKSNYRDHTENPLTLLFAEHIHPRLENPVYVFRRTDSDSDVLRTVICDKLRQNSSLLIYNDETVIPAMENAGIDPFDAVNYTIHGCNWPDIQGMSVCVAQIGGPIPRMIMNAMFDENGNPRRNFTCIDDVYDAVGENFAASLRTPFENYRKNFAGRGIRPQTGSLNCAACFLHGAAERAGRTACIAKYPVIYGLLRNIGTAADMLAALETVVFGKAPVSMEVLCDALKKNFAGCEAIHKRLKSAPKYGRDEEAADRHAVRMMSMLQDIIDRESINPETGRRDVHVLNVTITDMWHIHEGAKLGATPDGRMAGAPLSENLSPSEGMSESVTALLNSVAKLPFERISSGALNVRMPKALVSGEDGLARMKILLDTYFENGGMQLQFSAADTSELRDAQIHPEKYRDLMVRITGYSAVFVDMCRKAQNEIIRRDELNG